MRSRGKRAILTLTQLTRLEEEFRSWSDAPSRSDIRASRKRILLIFLLIRYTGARLNEVLTLDLSKHIDVSRGVVRYGNSDTADRSFQREVQVSSELMSEIRTMLKDPYLRQSARFLVEGGCRPCPAEVLRTCCGMWFCTGPWFA